MKNTIILVLFILFSCDDINDSEDFEEFIPISEFFNFNESDLIAFYFFDNVIINDQTIDSLDWVAAFNGNICVGAKQWNCTSQSCEIPIYGENTLNSLTIGYMQSGQLPSFKIYDFSDSVYYNATPSQQFLWNNGDFNQIETLIAN